MVSVQTADSESILIAKAGAKVSQFLAEFYDLPVTILFSGGSALKLLPAIETGYLGSWVMIGVLDERFSKNPKENNFAQIAATPFYEEARKQGCHFIDTRVQEGETMAFLAKRFADALHEFKKKNPQGIIIATAGMGEDGHTAGIMPYPEDSAAFADLFEDESHWVVGYDAGSKNPWPLRVTTTMPFLRRINHTIFFISGANKLEALTKALSGIEPLHRVPAAIMSKMPDVHLFTDLTLKGRP